MLDPRLVKNRHQSLHLPRHFQSAFVSWPKPLQMHSRLTQVSMLLERHQPRRLAWHERQLTLANLHWPHRLQIKQTLPID